MASVKAQIVLDFTGVVDLDQIVISVDGIVETFTATSGPPSGNLFSLGQGSDYDATAYYFTTMFNSISSGYNLTIVGSVVTIDAISWGSVYNFGSAGGNITVVSQRDNNVETIGIIMATTNILCFGSSTGAIDVEITGGAWPFTFEWDDGPATTKDRIDIPFGNGYKITVTDSIGNQASKTTNIYQPPEINISATTVMATGGGSNGSIDVSVFGGVAPYTYAWDDGPETTQDRNAIAAGTYKVTVTDSNGCIKDNSFTVIDGGSTIVITETITNVICNGEDNGAIQTVISGGVAPYTYLWRNQNGSIIQGSTGSDITDFVAGIYHLVVTDDVGSIQEKFIEITQPDPLVITSSITGNNIETTIVGGTTPYTYLWSNGETTKDITVINEGDYSITVTDANGCTAQLVATVSPFVFFFTENPIELSLEAELGQVNHSFVCEVFVEQTHLSGSFTKVVKLEQPVGDADDTIFDVQEVIDAYLTEKLPNFNENTIKLSDGHFKRFYLKYAEKYGNPPVESSFSQQSTFYAIIGGLSDLEVASGSFFNSYLPTVKPFLTWEQVYKEVYEDSQVYLDYVINEFDLSGIELHIKIYYKDETTLTTQILNQIGSPNRFEMYRIPMGHNQLDLQSFAPTKEIDKYEVWVEDNADNKKSEIRTFILVDRPTFTREFIYLNSLGGWSTLIAEGYATGKMKVKETVLQQKLESGYLVTDPEAEVVKKTGQQQLMVSGGYLDNVNAAHLQDFAISKRVFEIKSNRFEPVRIKFNPNYMDEENNYVEASFIVLPPITKKYTPPL